MRPRQPECSPFESLDILSRFDTMQKVPRGRPGRAWELPAGRSRHASMKGPSQCHLAWLLGLQTSEVDLSDNRDKRGIHPAKGKAAQGK